MIQEEQAKAPEDEADKAEETGADSEAKYSTAWDEIDAEETGQPSDAEGRQGAGDEPSEDDEKEAGQGGEAATPSADAEPASRDETTDDESEPAKLREALKAERERAEKAENLARSHGGRLAQTLNELQDLKKSLESKKAEGATPEGEEALEEDERIKQLREDYPEVADPLLEKIAKLEAVVLKLGAGQEAAQGEATEAEIETLFTEQLEALTSKHDDFATVVQSSEYRTWLQRADPLVQRVIQENSPRIVNAAECAAILDRFKSETGWGQQRREAVEKVEQKRERQLAAGREAPTRQPAVTRDEAGSFGDEWDRLDAQDRRRSTGRR